MRADQKNNDEQCHTCASSRKTNVGRASSPATLPEVSARTRARTRMRVVPVCSSTLSARVIAVDGNAVDAMLLRSGRSGTSSVPMAGPRRRRSAFARSSALGGSSSVSLPAATMPSSSSHCVQTARHGAKASSSYALPQPLPTRTRPSDSKMAMQADAKCVLPLPLGPSTRRQQPSPLGAQTVKCAPTIFCFARS